MKSDMINYLRDIYIGEYDDFSVETAIYWFANDYHQGQASELYSILSTSPYHPSPMCGSINGEDDFVKMMYEDLVCVYNV